MSKIEIYKNDEPGPAWCAIGGLGDAGYYAGSDNREDLLALIQQAAEMEGVIPLAPKIGRLGRPSMSMVRRWRRRLCSILPKRSASV